MITINDIKYLEIKDVAKSLKVSKRTIARLVQEKKLKAFRPSERKTYFSEKMIQDYLEGN